MTTKTKNTGTDTQEQVNTAANASADAETSNTSSTSGTDTGDEVYVPSEAERLLEELSVVKVELAAITEQRDALNADLAKAQTDLSAAQTEITGLTERLKAAEDAVTASLEGDGEGDPLLPLEPVVTVSMARDEPLEAEGPTTADVHPDEVEQMIGWGWYVVDGGSHG